VEEKTVNLTLDENGNILNERNLPKILVVDDEEINLRIMKAYLMERDYEILCAKRGAEAVELASKENIDAMVCDIKMPDMDGMQVLKWSSQNRPLMPVVMLTGFVDLATAIAVMREGARNYLTKPIEAKALLDAVDSALAYRRNALQTLARQQDALGYQQELERKIEDSGLKSQKMALDVVVALTNVVKTRSRRLSRSLQARYALRQPARARDNARRRNEPRSSARLFAARYRLRRPQRRYCRTHAIFFRTRIFAL